MLLILNSPYFQFSFNPKIGTWSLHGVHENAPFIEDACMQVEYRSQNRSIRALQNWRNFVVEDSNEIESRNGILSQIKISQGPDRQGLHYKIEFVP